MRPELAVVKQMLTTRASHENGICRKADFRQCAPLMKHLLTEPAPAVVGRHCRRHEKPSAEGDPEEPQPVKNWFIAELRGIARCAQNANSVPSFSPGLRGAPLEMVGWENTDDQPKLPLPPSFPSFFLLALPSSREACCLCYTKQTKETENFVVRPGAGGICPGPLDVLVLGAIGPVLAWLNTRPITGGVSQGLGIPAWQLI